MRRRNVIVASLVLLWAEVACSPATQGNPGPTVDSVPRPTDTSGPPPTPIPPTATPQPTFDGSGAGGTPITAIGDNTLPGFRQALLDNLTSRNYGFLLYSMSDLFTIRLWGGQDLTFPPNQAIDQLRATYLPPQSFIHYNLDQDITALLGGTPPDQAFGPDVTIVSAVYMDGWGADGKAQAIIFISQTPDGVFAWYGVIFAAQGFH